MAISSLSLIYQGEAKAAKGGNSVDHGGGPGNSQGRGNSQGAGNSLGLRLDLIKAENASDTARLHAAHESAVVLADPDHYLDGHDHNTD